VDHTEQVCLDDISENLGRCLVEAAERPHAGIIDPDVDSAECPDRPIRQRADGPFVDHVGWHYQGSRSQLLALHGHLMEELLAAGGEHQRLSTASGKWGVLSLVEARN
jgi:hypothetical protein